MLRGKILATLAMLLAAGGEVSAAQSSVASDTPTCRASSQWYLPKSATSVAFAEAVRDLARHRVVLLGEHHDNPDHHRWQLHTVAAIAGQVPKLALGFEMFPRRVQPVLDEWVRGELSEEEFVQKVDWDSIWSFDVQHYLPLFQFARLHRVPMLALNVGRALSTRVAQEGWDAIPVGEREGIVTPAPPSKEYLRYLAGSFLSHNPGDAPGQDNVTAVQGQRFLRFLQGQQLWDRAMAQGIADVARQSDAPLVIGIIGSGHLAHRFGVPAQLADLDVSDAVIALPWDTHFQCDELRPTMSDYVFGVKR